MKNFTILLVAALCFSLTGLNAQLTLRFGPEAGVTFNKEVGKYLGEKYSSDKFGIGFKIGGIADLAIGEMISIQPGIFFNRIANKVDNELIVEVGGVVVSHSKTEGNAFTNAISIPVGLQFAFGESSKFFVGVGPQLDYFLSGKQKITTTNVLTGGKTEIDETREWTDDDVRLNLSGMVNAGYLMSNGLFFRASLVQGFTNLIKDGGSDNRANTQQFGLSLGYLLGAD